MEEHESKDYSFQISLKYPKSRERRKRREQEKKKETEKLLAKKILGEKRRESGKDNVQRKKYTRGQNYCDREPDNSVKTVSK